MKIDRFVKVMLVLIAVLLALNCAKDINLQSDSRGNSGNLSNSSVNSGNTGSYNSAGSSNSSMFESSAEAAPAPSFLQVDKSYACYVGGSETKFRVLEIQNTGWVKVKISGFPNDATGWINPSAFEFITPL